MLLDMERDAALQEEEEEASMVPEVGAEDAG